MICSVEMQFQKIIKGQPYKLTLPRPKMLIPEQGMDNRVERQMLIQDVIPSPSQLKVLPKAAVTSTWKQNLLSILPQFSRKKKNEAWLERSKQDCQGMRYQIGRCARINHHHFLQTDQSSKLPSSRSKWEILCFHCAAKSLALWPAGRYPPHLSSSAYHWAPVQPWPSWHCTHIQSLSRSSLVAQWVKDSVLSLLQTCLTINSLL